MRKLNYFIMLGVMCSATLHATSLRESVEDTLNTNPSIIAEHLNRDAYEMFILQEEADYLPTLNLDAFLEKSKTENRPDTPPPAEGWSDKDGWNAILKLEHILYDGGLTPSQVQEFRHRYNSNKYRSILQVENTILDTVNAYIDLTSRQELVALSSYNIKIHEEYLEIAKEKEEISGEVLETYQVNSKYHSVLDRFLEQENEQQQALSLYKKLVGKDLQGDICKPIVSESFLPPSLDEAIKVGLRRSYKIKEQIEKIEEQKEKIVQEKAGFKPTLRLQFQSLLDNDLELAENGRQDVHSARLYLSWNLFNGGKTYHATQKEKLFLQEEQRKLDALTNEVIDEIKEAYNSFYNLQKRIKNINLYVEDNFNILSVYKKQLLDGTRTFIDILNAESEYYRSNIDKIEQEYEYVSAYYNLLFNMSMLSDAILMQEKQSCTQYQFIPKDSDPKVESPELSEDLLNLFDETPTTEEVPQNSSETIDIDSRLNHLYNDEKTSNKVDDTNKNLQYTIKIAMFQNEENLMDYVKKYQLENSYGVNKFTTRKDIQLTYGVFETYQEAKDSLAKLHPDVLIFGAYIDKIDSGK